MVFDTLNEISDFVVPIYFIVVIAIFVLYNNQKVAIASNNNPFRTYSWIKVDKNAAATWQSQMAGTWDKLERKNFYEVNTLVFSSIFTNNI